MENGDTKLGGLKRELTAWRKEFMSSPPKTILLGLGIVLFVGLVSIAPRAFNDVYSVIFYQTPQNPFSDTQTIYSNFVPLEHDIIDLDNAGTLTPSPYNLLYSLNSEEICTSTGNQKVGYSEGIVLILNVAPTLSSQGIRRISFRLPPDSSYFTFESGITHTIKTNERIFLVTLSHINDLSTEKNGLYFSYVFKINEK